MRKAREVLRLRFGLGLRQNQIARSCSIGQATVHRYLERAAERYLLAEWKTVRASIDYHVEIDRHYYSVPYQLAGESMRKKRTRKPPEEEQ